MRRGSLWRPPRAWPGVSAGGVERGARRPAIRVVDARALRGHLGERARLRRVAVRRGPNGLAQGVVALGHGLARRVGLVLVEGLLGDDLVEINLPRLVAAGEELRVAGL